MRGCGRAGAGSRRVRFVEALEDPLAILDRDARAVVPDHQSRPARVHLETDRDGRTGVPERIVDEDPQELPQRVLVAGHLDVDQVDLEPALGMDGRRLASHVHDHRTQVDWRELEPKPRVRARQREQSIDQPAHALAFLRNVRGGRTLDRFGDRRPVRKQARVALDGRQRRPQLVRRVGDEAALRVQRGGEPSIGVLELVQHAVEAGGEQRHLITASGSGQAAPEIARAGDLSGRPQNARGRRISPPPPATTLSALSALPATSHEATSAASRVGTPEMIRKPTMPERFDCGTRVDWPVTTYPPAYGSAYRRSPVPPGIVSVANEPREAAAWLRSVSGTAGGEPLSCAVE